MDDDELERVKAELERRGALPEWAAHPDMVEMQAEHTARFANRFAQVDTDHSLAAVEAELARREAENADPMVVVGRAISALASAFTELAASVAQIQRPTVKTIERDEAGNISRIVETPQ